MKPPVASPPPPTTRESLRLARRLLLLIRPYWRPLAKGLVVSLAIGAFGMITPLLSKLFFDEVYPSRDVTFMEVLVISVAVVGISSTLMGAVRNYYGQVIGARLSTQLRLLFFNHVQHLQTRFFDDRKVGEILSRSGDLQRSVDFVSGVFQTVLINGVYLVLAPPIMLALNWKLALLAMATVPITTTTSLITGRALRALAKRNLEFAADASAYQVEVLSNIRVVKSLAAEPQVFGEMRTRLLRAQEFLLKSAGLGAVLGVVNATVRAAGMAVFSWYAWSLILSGDLSLGSFIAFSAYLGYLTGPVGQFASLFTTLQQAAVSFGRFFEYYDAVVEQPPAGSERPRGPIVRPLHGEVEFRDVTFGYGADKPVLTNVSFRFGRGVTALVGRSGSGKSSIVRMLMRMYAPQGGSILVDGSSIEQFQLADLRRQVGVVWQDNGAFRGTVRENLLLGADEVSEDRIREAVRMARLEEFVQSLPQGLETTVAEWGGTLSGGQRQRLAIARAIVRRSPLLILDEATSNLDSETEEELLRAVLPLGAQATVLFITHRLISASLADRIFIVADQSVTGGTSHAKLLDSDERYRMLWHAAMMTGLGPAPSTKERTHAASGMLARGRPS